MKRMENDQVREEIVLASDAVFERYGFLRVSMQDISNECKKGRSTLYHYFKNKEEVFDAVCERLFLNCLAESKGTISKRRSFSANIESFNVNKLKDLRHIVSKYKLVIDDLRLDPSGFILKFRKFAEEEVAVFKQIIQWGIENKDIGELSEEDIDFLSETLNAAFKSFEQEVIVFGKFPQSDSKVAWLAQMLQKGLK
ncbi:TetR/AcrR family transcriptional regulator [Mucilaginibacter psychrotolerans]|uniref:TetR/AcrR family transcriptional regulator n=1 Tax=Mucilaginibacter psychrotolerans TaxID=1524096 RepID=A0A4Y8S764_9SPHI|nr:TetR/AcrR family transcriptional regulator [Mucilaginibacter psychrotolerans]TFF34586.1 TetR/AcrR family transcriptional regulator [Mucilaginibacter psychrotolerans]